MLENISPEILESFENAITFIIPILFSLFGIRLALSVVSGGSSYGFFDYVSDVLSSFIDIVKSLFSKPKEKTPVDFSSEWDNGFFNSDVYNSFGGEKND